VFRRRVFRRRVRFSLGDGNQNYDNNMICNDVDSLVVGLSYAVRVWLLMLIAVIGAWLIQIKDAGHLLMLQYPDKFNKVLQAFLSTTSN
jgi:pimeloyl-ACP methyl ester carboxylesterase